MVGRTPCRASSRPCASSARRRRSTTTSSSSSQKIDGFRALAYIDGHQCQLVSRNGHVFNSWPQLAEEIAYALRVRSAVIDGENCCLDPDGRSNFKKLMFRREWPYFYAFDLLAVDGRDLRAFPLVERKALLVDVMPKIDCRVLYLDNTATS